MRVHDPLLWLQRVVSSAQIDSLQALPREAAASAFGGAAMQQFVTTSPLTASL
jgi:hypothetical protein